jgi:hypothetical protein
MAQTVPNRQGHAVTNPNLTGMLDIAVAWSMVDLGNGI